LSLRLKISTHKTIIFLVVPDNILPPSSSEQDTMVLSYSHHDKEFIACAEDFGMNRNM